MTGEHKDLSEAAKKAPPTAENREAEKPLRRKLLYRNGWHVLPSRGAVVTNEMINKIQEELDREDARIAWGEPSPDAK
jgi:hypothetical protein